MRPSRSRLMAFAAALAVAWTLLLLLAAGVRWNTPLQSAGERSLPGSNFNPAFGRVELDAHDRQRLRVTTAAADGSALQMAQVPELDAARFPILSYQFENFPRTLELSLVFRTAGMDDVVSVSVPRPVDGRMQTVDLSALPEWKGALIEIGFAQFPVAQLTPPRDAFRPFTLVKARLHGDSWLGKLAAMLTAWSAHSPWQFVSISALGPSEIGDSAPHAPRPPLVAALAWLLAAGLARWLLGLRGRALARLLGVGAGVAWIVLDLGWLGELRYKRLADYDSWAATPLAARQNRVADIELLEAARHLKQVLRDEPSDRHVVIYAGSPFNAIRLAYHAAPLNVGVAAALPASLVEGMPRGTIVRYGLPASPDQDRLDFGGRLQRVQKLDEGERMTVYRVLGRAS